ncbi:MAG: DL-endopeptidase inhibitor IseA family protein [Ruminiclostridium sp.]
MKMDEKFWDETLGGLDEKYINETAEKLAENDIFAAEHQTTPQLMKIPPQKKSRWGVVLGVCAGIAAVVCLCLIGVIAGNMRSIEIKVTGTPATTLPPVTIQSDDTAKPESTSQPAESTISDTTLPAVTSQSEENTTSEPEDTEEIFTPQPDDDELKLPEALFTGAPTMDFSIMDNYFYGRWTGIDDTLEECELFITNGKDCFAEPEGYGVVCTGFYSDEQGWYMTGMFGGTLTCYYIPADEPDRMYCYYNLDEPCQRKNFEMYYDRVAPVSDYNRDMSTYYGEISSLGLIRLKQLTGFEFIEEMTTITVDGIRWIRDTDRYSSPSKLYCTYLKNELSFTMRYVRYSEEYESNSEPQRQYITLNLEQKNGEWEMTSAERYKSGIEELKTPAYLKAQKTVDVINADILKQNPEESTLCKLSSEVRYFTADEGYYYAVRRFGPDMALDLEYGEIYYFNGLDYTAIDEYGNLTGDYVMEDYSVGWIKGAECIEGYLYAGVQSDGKENIYRYDSSGKREVFLAGFSGLQLLGENYLLLSNGGVSRLYDIASGYYHLPADITKLVFDEDGGGFTATMSPDIDLHIRYNIKEMTIEEQVKLLNLKADHIWTYTQLQSPAVDQGEGKAAILHDSGGQLVYPVIQEEFKNYDNVYNLISSVYTESCTNEILSQELPTYMRFMTLGKTYCSGGGSGTLVGVARIECKVKSVSGNTAELEYTAYYPNFDGLPQEEVDVHEVYTIEAVNTDKGWRLCRYYSPYMPGTQ